MPETIPPNSDANAIALCSSLWLFALNKWIYWCFFAGWLGLISIDVNVWQCRKLTGGAAGRAGGAGGTFFTAFLAT